jgi:hypothetical protein
MANVLRVSVFIATYSNDFCGYPGGLVSSCGRLCKSLIGSEGEFSVVVLYSLGCLHERGTEDGMSALPTVSADVRHTSDRAVLPKNVD